jgi:hypothetical protein
MKTNQSGCRVRLDRLIVNAVGERSSTLPEIDGFHLATDFRPRPQGRIATYARVRSLRSATSSSRIFIQHKPQQPWLKPWRIKLEGDDERGLTPREVGSVIAHCINHKVSLAEVAVDFDSTVGVDMKFVMRHGKFGKSQRRTGEGWTEYLRYGSRGSAKMVRCYPKKQLDCYRTELEIHSGLLRKQRISRVRDLSTLVARLFPAHIQFVAIRWKKLTPYLIRKFGSDGERICDETRRRAEVSLGRATRYLSAKGVPNPHRFLGPLRINRVVRAALRRWAERFSPEQLE